MRRSNAGSKFAARLVAKITTPSYCSSSCSKTLTTVFVYSWPWAIGLCIPMALLLGILVALGRMYAGAPLPLLITTVEAVRPPEEDAGAPDA
mgnify:CR=1 FL=1